MNHPQFYYLIEGRQAVSGNWLPLFKNKSLNKISKQYKAMLNAGSKSNLLRVVYVEANIVPKYAIFD